MIEDSHIRKFAAVYAEAALTFLDSNEAQWVTWDGVSHQFDFSSVELDDPEVPAMLFVDATWTQVVDVNEITDPDSPDFDPEALRGAIEDYLIDEGFAERLLKGFQERLENIRGGYEDTDDGVDDDDR